MQKAYLEVHNNDLMMEPPGSTYRFLLGAMCAFGVTFCLIAGMIKLIHVEAIPVDIPDWEVLDPVLVPVEPGPIDRVKPPEPIEDPMHEPDLPTFEPSIDTAVQNEGVIPVSPGRIQRPTITGGGNQAIPLAMVQPTYPRRAAAQGIEGYVDIGFDVQASGMTHNIHVLAAQPPGVFEREAKKAVKKWRFSPAYEKGKAVASAGFVHRIVFEMEK